MTRAQLVSALAFFLITCRANAQMNCPTSHFVPTREYGAVIGDTGQIIHAQVEKNKGDEVKFDYIEYQAYSQAEAGYTQIFRVSLFESEDKQWHIALVRQRRAVDKTSHGDIDILDRAIDANHAEEVIRAAADVLKRTHYPATGCSVLYTDGYWSQAYVRPIDAMGKYVGEVYVPPEGSEAEGLIQLGRTLKNYISGKTADAELENSLNRVRHALQP